MRARLGRALTPRLTQRNAALAAGLGLAAVYAATVAPNVTFWDAGAFLTAFATFGIPHPPGTPLFVALGRAWTVAAMSFGVGGALAGGLLSAACTAAAGACTAWLVARWTRSGACGVAAALCAGTMSTAWANATETEVYAASLALACAALAAGEWAGARAPDTARGARGAAATAYAVALAVPLHLSALLAAPAALWLACAPAGAGTFRAAAATLARPRAFALLAAAVAAAGVGSARVGPIALGLVGLVASIAMGQRGGARVRPTLEPFAVAGATVVAASATLVLLLRAQHDPWLNQGDPSTWARLVDVVGRRQYAVADLWPRQAPWWLQLANLGEWADWQVALGRAPGPEPSWARTPVTLAYAALGVVGSAWHWRTDRRSWVAVLLLLGAGTVGAAAYLNLKAGPSFGAGVLPDAAPHEARERDYFFVLGWWAWGVWAGTGAVVAARVAGRIADRAIPRAAGQGRHAVASAAGVALAALPLAFNWRVASRAGPPAAHAAADYARALLENAPDYAVLVVNGDNDTYPLWQAQAALGVRRDVSVVTISLLPAAWYRAELARRTALLPRDASVWLGSAAVLATIRARAARQHRPLAVSLATDASTRMALAQPDGAWVLRGLTLSWSPAGAAANGASPRGEIATLPSVLAAVVGTDRVNTHAVETAAARAPHVPAAWLHDATGDGVVAWAHRQLACPAAAVASGTAAARSLEGPCRAR